MPRSVEHRLGLDRRRPVGGLDDQRRRRSRSATSASITPPSAAGTSSSHSTSQMASAAIGSPPANPATEPVSATWSARAPDVEAALVEHRPADVAHGHHPHAGRRAAGRPAARRPCRSPARTARLPTSGMPSSRKATRAHVEAARRRGAGVVAGAADRQRLAGDRRRAACWPWTIDSVSISQAITRPSVLTSGAGMSVSGPSSGLIS